MRHLRNSGLDQERISFESGEVKEQTNIIYFYNIVTVFKKAIEFFIDFFETCLQMRFRILMFHLFFS